MHSQRLRTLYFSRHRASVVVSGSSTTMSSYPVAPHHPNSLRSAYRPIVPEQADWIFRYSVGALAPTATPGGHFVPAIQANDNYPNSEYELRAPRFRSADARYSKVDRSDGDEPSDRTSENSGISESPDIMREASRVEVMVVLPSLPFTNRT